MLDILCTAIGIIAIVLIWIVLYDSNRFVVVRHAFTDKKISESYRAVILADLHNKRYGKNNEILLKAIRDQNPDGIFIVGDILTAKPGAGTKAAIAIMTELAGDYPIYYGNGNHEHRLKLYPEKYGTMGTDYEAALREMGVRLLVNSHTELKHHNIIIYGAEIDKFYYKRFRVPTMPEEYLGTILGKSEQSRYVILMAHNPDYFERYANWGADLILAGHVHGGMVRIPFLGKGVLSPGYRILPKYDGGIFREKNSTMLLSRGLGMHTIPIRLFNPGELIVADFLPEREEKSEQ